MNASDASSPPVAPSWDSVLAMNALAYDGTWRVGAQAITAGPRARLRLRYEAAHVYVVMGGRGTVQALVDGRPVRTIHVDAERLYTVWSGASRQALLELRFSRGVRGYSFTFG